MDMKLIPMFCKLDFAMLCIGGYFTMDWQDAIIASDFIECNKIIGMHYDSFPPIKIDSKAAVAALKKKERN
jgi:L-ascorbate metabolism protein UlaG (beta-lactamase superfamily)